MNRVRILLIWVAFWATCYASLAFITNLDPDFELAAIIAALCLFTAIVLDYIGCQRRQMAERRERVWRRRDEEAGLP
jgi:hypothetical protein